jgi:hypothetical protein
MNCCHTDGDPAAPAVPAPSRRSRRTASFVQWAIPITALALIPKCPACVGAYILLFTGVGLSVSAASVTRWILISLCMAALGYLCIRAVRRVLIRPA